MANLEAIIAGKAARDTEWQAQQQAERDSVTSMQDFGVESILKRGGNHQWNMVYVEGQWWDVDVTANDAGDEISNREYATILWTPEEFSQTGGVDEEPEVTAFVKELLVPGSTK